MSKTGLNPLSIKKYWKNQRPPDLNHLKATRQKFKDPYFPPNINSLTSRDKNGKFIDAVKGPEHLRDMEEDNPGGTKRLIWKSVTEIYPKWQLFEGKIEFNDVKQGSLGDCYFLSSITALTEYSRLIVEKFRTNSFNEIGYYETIFFIDGEWQIVFIDDYFPFDPRKNNFAFATPNGKELWAMLLEKAWAKINGGYSNAVGGIVSDPISALTGFPTEYLHHNQYENDEVYKKIEEGDKEGTIMSSASKKDNSLEKKGLIQCHAYTLIEAKKWESRKIFLLKLRNPWGEKEWKGRWSDNSPLWTAEYKRYFGAEMKKNDGVFWIDIDDYVKNFDSTYICHIFYGALVKNFYFEYENYFKRPAIFNIYIKEKSKTSISVLFKGWRFNRDIHDVIHPFSLVLCKYDQNRKIKKLYGKWSSKDDINFIENLEAGYYVLWLYCPYDYVKGDKNFKYAVQVCCKKEFAIEFLGLDESFMLIQYLLLENYKITGKNNLASSKEYFIGSDRDLTQAGISSLLIYNKSNRTLEVTASGKCVTNVQIIPPYQGMKNIKMVLPPHENVAIIGIRLSNNAINFSYSFSLSMSNKIDKNYNNKNNLGERYANFLKFDISNRSNPDMMGLRTGEYKFAGKELAKIPKLDNTIFVSKDILKISMMRKEEITPQTLAKEFPKEIALLLKKFPKDISPEINKKWDKIPTKDGIYLGQINASNGNLEGRGIFIWKSGIKYIGYWKDSEMNGEGVIFDKNNNLIFNGNYYHGKKYGKGKFIIKDNEYYEGEFFDDKMEGKGTYHYNNGDIWEGNFSNNQKNGIGILTLQNGDSYLVKFEKDNYMGGTKLTKEEKAKVFNMGNEERKKMFEYEKQRQIERANEAKYQENQRKKINQLKDEEMRKKLIAEEKKRIAMENEKKNKKYNNLENLFLAKSVINPFVDVEESNNEVQETNEEKNHRIYLENIEDYKKKEPFMMEKFSELRPLNYEEEMHYEEKNGKKYLGGMINKNNKKVMQGRGVLFNGKYYFAGYWNNNLPNGFFFRYNNKKEIVFQGFLTPDYNIDPRYPGFLYFSNGDKYEGYFKNNKLNGFGIYYYSKGDSWTGNFKNGEFDGRGKYFYENGLLSEFITYKNNQVIDKEKTQREDYEDPNSVNFFKEVKTKFPGVLEHLLLVPPLRDAYGYLKWTIQNLNDGNVYIGQINFQNKFHGRCCFIYKNAPITYYVGYIKNQQFVDSGAYYNKNWSNIYEGKFENNKRSGFGVQKLNDGSIYAGEFNNDLPNGKGVFYFPNGSRFEGNVINGEKTDKGFLISPDFTVKQELTYKNGNVIEQGEIIDYKKSKNKKIFKQNFEEFLIKCKKNGYEKYVKLLMNLKPTKDFYTLIKGIKEEVSGIYIGEMNSIGFKYGRGVFINNYTKEFYVGYFVNNEKHGNGVNYKNFGVPLYIGEFKRDKPKGKGEFHYRNGEILQGKFNSVGEGDGVYTFEDGAYWKGHFYAWTLNGTGEYFGKDGTSYGIKKYELNKCINDKK